MAREIQMGSQIKMIPKFEETCLRLLQNQKDVNSLKDLQNIINTASPHIIGPPVLSVLFTILQSIAEDKSKFTAIEKQVIVDTLKCLFDKMEVEKLPIFFNIYGFLLLELYDVKNHSVLNIPEEYKLSIVECMIALTNSLSYPVVTKLYVKENALKLCQMLYVLLTMATSEQYKKLRIACINCLMTMARVLDDNDFSDLVMRDQVAEMFMFFLPGAATHLKNIALVDEKIGHQIPALALKAWGRIVTLLMQDYNAYDNKINVKASVASQQKKLKDEKELNEYLAKAQRSPQWYCDNDFKLQRIIVEFAKLTHHSHPKVRMELAAMSSLIIENCIETMPTSISQLIEIVIALSEDSDEATAQKSKIVLETLSSKFTTNESKSLLENLEEGFYNAITRLPRKFNGIDEMEQISALNLVIGYISLFDKHNLTRVLHSTVHLNQLMLTLIHISEFDKRHVSLLEELTTQDFEPVAVTQTPWKNFKLFQSDVIEKKIETICSLLATLGASSIISDFLLDKFESESEYKNEVVFLLNGLITGMISENSNTIKNILVTYTEKNNWYLPLTVMVDEEGYEHNLGDVQNNIIQVCLLVEGIGKISLSMKKDFEQFMLKTLYFVLERAGSGHPFIKAAGTSALSNIAKSCEYFQVTNLINANIDYFSFHVQRKLNQASVNEGVLDVLAVVMSYSSIDVLNSTSDIVRELLMQSCDKHRGINVDPYLRVFKMFIHCLHRWLDIKVEPRTIKTKKQKQEELEDFQVSDIDYNQDFSDDVMGKSAEELYREDMEKSQKELQEEIEGVHMEDAKKPELPMHVKLTVTILKKTLNFLPSKERLRKLLVMDILKDGIVVIKDWENELLPIVHQIWSPLVDRFKEMDDPLVVNGSFQLLVILAQVSKDFIRSRTAKDVLPNILSVLDKLSQNSYLKDKGSSYRYTQAYKLQLVILEELAMAIIDLDMLENQVQSAMDTVSKYLSDRQPIPLQKAAVGFFKTLKMYDPPPVEEKLKSSLDKNPSNEYTKNIKYVLEQSGAT